MLLVAAGLAIIYLFPRLTKAVPSPLVAIVVLTVVTIYGGIDVNTVGDMGKLPTSLAGVRAAARAAHLRDAAGSSCPIR